MPEFLEKKLKAEYGSNSKIPYKVMNKIGAMSGPNETKKGAEMEHKHIEHVHEHLQTEHTSPHKGVKTDGEAHTGHVAGSLPAHKHEGVTHFYKK